MKEELIGFEVAKLAKEKGFNITNRNSYDENTGLMLPLDPYGHCYALEGTCPAPTQSLLQKWLREKHGIFIGIDCNHDKYRFHAYNVNVNNDKYPKYKGVEDTYLFEFGTEEFIYNSYEKALKNGLQEALKLI